MSDHLQLIVYTDPAASTRAAAKLKPIAGLLHHQLHEISLDQYIELVA